MLALGLAFGCGEEDGAAALGDRVDRVAFARATAYCGCRGGDDPPCVEALVGPVAERSCRRDARRTRLRRLSAGLLEAGLRCAVAADEEDAACLSAAAGDGCDPDALVACDAARGDALSACPEIPLEDASAIDREVFACLGAPGCPVVDLGPTVSMVVTGTTRGRADDFDATCAGFGGPDITVRWVAPLDGTYSVRTTGSSFDTVLSVYQSCLDERPLVCDDDDNGLNPEVRVPAVAGDEFLFVVDGFDADESGTYFLGIAPFERPD